MSETPETTTDTEPKEGQPEVVEIEGKDIPVSELKAGYLRQSDYTRKTQEIAALRNKFKVYEELDEYMVKHPDKRDKLMAIFQDEPEQVDEPDEEPEQEEEEDTLSNEREELRKEVEAMRKDLQDMRTSAKSTELEIQLERALKEYPKADRNAVIAAAYLPSNEKRSFAELAKDEQARLEAMEAKVRESVMKELQESGKPGLGQGTAPGLSRPKDDKPKWAADSKRGARALLDEADAEMIRALRQSNED